MGRVKGFLNNVKKNCRSGRGGHPLSPVTILSFFLCILPTRKSAAVLFPALDPKVVIYFKPTYLQTYRQIASNSLLDVKMSNIPGSTFLPRMISEREGRN